MVRRGSSNKLLDVLDGKHLRRLKIYNIHAEFGVACSVIVKHDKVPTQLVTVA